MNQYSPLNAERRAARVLEDLLAEIPQVEVVSMKREVALIGDYRFDVVAELALAGRPAQLVVEVKANGQPRVIREAAIKLKRLLRDQSQGAVPLMMAPYLSEQARAVCKEEEIGFADFLGNAHIVFDTVYIDRQVADRPEPERRALRSLSKPKTARILRLLLREPSQVWRVSSLAEEAQVSVGMVSTVGKALRERGWAEQTGDGLVLVDPNDLLDSWAEEYVPPRTEELRLYSHLHGDDLLKRIRSAASCDGRFVLAGFSAADWLAPYVRQSTTYFYADEQGAEALKQALDLSPAAKGANCVIRIPEEDGVLEDHVEAGEGLRVTSPVQTYLDLLQLGERGREGAEHLRNQKLKWPR
jgi:hypothetical protein